MRAVLNPPVSVPLIAAWASRQVWAAPFGRATVPPIPSGTGRYETVCHDTAGTSIAARRSGAVRSDSHDLLSGLPSMPTAYITQSLMYREIVRWTSVLGSVPPAFASFTPPYSRSRSSTSMLNGSAKPKPSGVVEPAAPGRLNTVVNARAMLSPTSDVTPPTAATPIGTLSTGTASCVSRSHTTVSTFGPYMAAYIIHPTSRYCSSSLCVTSARAAATRTPHKRPNATRLSKKFALFVSIATPSSTVARRWPSAMDTIVNSSAWFGGGGGACPHALDTAPIESADNATANTSRTVTAPTVGAVRMVCDPLRAVISIATRPGRPVASRVAPSLVAAPFPWSRCF